MQKRMRKPAQSEEPIVDFAVKKNKLQRLKDRVLSWEYK